MPELSLSNLVAVVAVAFADPLLLGLVPWLRLPSVVGELVAGIVLGPSLLGWVEVDLPLEVMALLGLAFLLFLSGLAADLDPPAGHHRPDPGSRCRPAAGRPGRRRAALGAAVPAARPHGPAAGAGSGAGRTGQRRQSRNARSSPAIASGGTASTAGRPATRMTARICSR